MYKFGQKRKKNHSIPSLSHLVRLNFSLSMFLDRNFGLRLSLSESLMGLAICLSKSLLFDLSLDLDRTLYQRKAKSKVKVTPCTVGLKVDTA